MERTKLLTITVIGLLVLNLLTIGVLVFRTNQRPAPPGGEEPARVIIDRLHLDTVQQQQYRQLITQHQQQTRQLSEQAKELYRTYYGLLEATPVDSVRANALSQEIAANQRTSAQVNFAHFQQIKALCRPEQQADFVRLVAELSRLFGRSQRPDRGGPPNGPPPGSPNGPPPGQPNP